MPHLLAIPCRQKKLRLIFYSNEIRLLFYNIGRKEIEMTLKLLNYARREAHFDIGNLEDIERIDLMILTGDEIATVTYKNGDKREFDSDVDENRMSGYFDSCYNIYDMLHTENSLLNNGRWLSRTSSYDY